MVNPSLRSHWFFLVAPLVVAVDLWVAHAAQGRFDRVLEAGLLFDLAVLVPSLYWLCYRNRGRRAAVRAAALACVGIWAAVKLVPADEQHLMHHVAPLRYVGLAALIALEAAVVIAIYRSVFAGNSAAQAAASAPEDLPPWAARLLAMEAALWRKAWLVIRRVFGRR